MANWAQMYKQSLAAFAKEGYITEATCLHCVSAMRANPYKGVPVTVFQPVGLSPSHPIGAVQLYPH